MNNILSPGARLAMVDYLKQSGFLDIALGPEGLVGGEIKLDPESVAPDIRIVTDADALAFFMIRTRGFSPAEIKDFIGETFKS